jgi:hypothetical protein
MDAFNATGFDDMADDLGAIYAPDRNAVSKAVNEVVYFEQACPKCTGSGMYYGASRYGMQCFTCKGKGKLSFKTSPATRAKAKDSAQRRATAKVDAQATKVAEWKEANPTETAWMESSAPRFEFAKSMLDALNKYGHLTEKQMATVQRLTVQSAERQAQYQAERQAKAETAPEVSVEAIEVAFNNAKQSGVKHPKLRLESFVFSPASESGKNAGAIYVKSKGDGVYLGKVMGGRLFTSRDCTSEAAQRITAVASDPKQAAIAYGMEFGSCSVCGRQLTDSDSVARGIGPICSEKYGF